MCNMDELNPESSWQSAAAWLTHRMVKTVMECADSAVIAGFRHN